MRDIGRSVNDHTVQTGDARERATLWRDPDLGGMELLRARFVTHAFARHAHEGFAIGVVERGGDRFRWRGAAHTATAGGLVLLNPAEPHDGQAATADGWAYRMFYPAADLLRRAASEIAGRPREVPFFPTPVAHDPALAGHLLRLHLFLEPDAAIGTLEREARFLDAMIRLIARHADDRPSPQTARPAHQAVARAKDFLDDAYPDDISLERLAQVAGLSRFHLLRVFGAEVGLPPHAYLTHVRVTRAKALLAAGHPPAAAAQAVGFADQSHLARHFKRAVGVPPAHYARGEVGRRQYGCSDRARRRTTND